MPKLDGVRNDIFYIPKRLCNLNINESLYKVEDLIQEEVHYKNYLQLKDGIYTVVDEKKIKSAGVAGVIRPGKNSVQVVIGTKVQFVADEFKKLCK